MLINFACRNGLNGGCNCRVGRTRARSDGQTITNDVRSGSETPSGCRSQKNFDDWGQVCIFFPGLDCIYLLTHFLCRANTDILLGKNCNLHTLMVGTGCHSLANIREWEKSEDSKTKRLVADFYIDKLADLQGLLEWICRRWWYDLITIIDVTVSRSIIRWNVLFMVVYVFWMSFQMIFCLGSKYFS